MSTTEKALVDVDTPIFGYFQALYMSFFSPKLYVDVGKRWKGFGLLYTLLVVIILTIPLGIKYSIVFNKNFSSELIEPINLLPKLVIQNGTLIFDKAMPFFIKNSQGDIIVIIDSTGEITDLDPKKYPKVSILVTKNSMVFKSGRFNQVIQSVDKNNTTFSFDEHDNEVFDPQIWLKQAHINLIKNFTTAIVYPAIIALFASLIMTFIPVMALLGQLFSTIFFTFKITFKQACRLMAVASTPVQLLLFTIITFFEGFTGIGIPLVALLAAYFSFAIVFLKRASTQMVIQ